MATWAEVNEVVQRVGGKLASERSIPAGSYNLVYAPLQPAGVHELHQGYNMIAGIRPTILFHTSVTDARAVDALVRAFNQLASLRRNGSVEVQSRLQTMHESIRALIPDRVVQASDLPASRLKVEAIRRVVITDKVTGLVSIQECPEKRGASWTGLMKAARRELALLVEMMEAAKMEVTP